MSTIEIICGDCLEVLKTLPSESVHCVVTSPPYWGLRDYGVAGQLGLEKTPEEYVAKMVEVFREVRRVLRKDGTCWVNLGDSYCGGGRNSGNSLELTTEKQRSNAGSFTEPSKIPDGLKPKDLCGIPWRVALALQADGWYLRQDIIWSKPNPMPESVTDRCTKAHEYIFLLSKSPRYFYDAEAIKEESAYPDDDRKRRAGMYHRKPTGELNYIREGSAKFPTRNKRSVWTAGEEPIVMYGRLAEKVNAFAEAHPEIDYGWFCDLIDEVFLDNKKSSVWKVSTQSFKEAHFATFPEKLIEPCILAGCPEWVCPKCGKARKRIVERARPPKEVFTETMKPAGVSAIGDHTVGMGQKLQDFYNDNPPKTIGWTDCKCGVEFVPGVVMDPFMGAGTTGLVAYKNRRDFIGIELKPEYAEMAKKRIGKEKDKMGLFPENKRSKK